jgi:hypothetical protein
VPPDYIRRRDGSATAVELPMQPYLCPFICVAGLSIVAEAALPSTAVAAASELALPAEMLTAPAPVAC